MLQTIHEWSADFLQAVWKAVGGLSARFLDRVSDGIIDVAGDDDEDEEEEEAGLRPEQPEADAPPVPESRKDQ